jgi:V/A-type H+-transporting ATPase subunit K
MEQNLIFAQIGPMLSLAIAAIGSCIGCYIAGAASHAAMSKTEEGHGKFIGMASAPASQIIYGFILMILLNKSIMRGSISEISGIVIGASAGLAFLTSSIFQGKVVATALQASIKQPALYGKCFAAVGILESFALFVFVFTLMII